MADSKVVTALQHLLKASNKEVIVNLCNKAVVLKDLNPTNYPEATVHELSTSLSITKGEAKQVIYHLSQLLRKAVFVYSSNPENISSAFPENFHQNLQELISNIIAKNFASWKSYLVSETTSLPRLHDVSWRIEQAEKKDEILGGSQAYCVLQLKVEARDDDTRLQNERRVDVMLMPEKLNAMLDGLSKIKDQLESVNR